MFARYAGEEDGRCLPATREEGDGRCLPAVQGREMSVIPALVGREMSGVWLLSWFLVPMLLRGIEGEIPRLAALARNDKDIVKLAWNDKVIVKLAWNDSSSNRFKAPERVTSRCRQAVAPAR